MTVTAAPPAPLRLRTLGECAAFFSQRATPRIIVQAIVVVAVLRIRAGGFTLADVLVPAAILALEPLTEWVIHVVVLHLRPRTVFGRTFDLHAARKHREHHGNPNDPRTSFVPLPDLLGLGVVAAAIEFALLRSTGAFLTGVLVSLAMLLTYEWTHFLIHTAYKPRHAYYRSIWRAHRLHHFRNENYWFGVTVTLGDRLLGTFPDRSDVEKSPTARSLLA